jgi:hypothetical protein
MKKTVAIMAVSLMLLTSCGKTKDIIGSGLKRGDVIGTESSGNSDLGKNNTSGIHKSFWKNYGKKICGSGSLVIIYAVLLFYDAK